MRNFVFAALAATQVAADVDIDPSYPTSFGPSYSFQLSTEGAVGEFNLTDAEKQSIILYFSFENLVTAIGIPDGNKVQNYA